MAVLHFLSYTSYHRLRFLRFGVGGGHDFEIQTHYAAIIPNRRDDFEFQELVDCEDQAIGPPERMPFENMFVTTSPPVKISVNSVNHSAPRRRRDVLAISPGLSLGPRERSREELETKRRWKRHSRTGTFSLFEAAFY
jgi:hypothetical protein